MLRFIKPGNLLCFELDDGRFVFRRIMAKGIVRHIAKISDVFLTNLLHYKNNRTRCPADGYFWPRGKRSVPLSANIAPRRLYGKVANQLKPNKERTAIKRQAPASKTGTCLMLKGLLEI